MTPIHTISEDIETLLQPTDKCVAYKSNHAAVITRWSQTAKDKLPDVIAKLKAITGKIEETVHHTFICMPFVFLMLIFALHWIV
jgi:hypothetical protein